MVRGRKRKPGLRHPCGRRVRAETEREAMATVLAARQRHHGVTARQARDERLGTALGRLAFHGIISEEQYEAGLCFGALYRRHHATLGLPLPSPRSVAGILINEGIFGGSSADPDPDLVERLRDRFGAATDALDACDRQQRASLAGRPTLLVYRLVCTDADASLWPPDDLGNLRVALNALARVFGLLR
jgi:hypothetical protein